MPKLKPELFSVLNDEQIKNVLMRLYKEVLKQVPSLMLHFLPKAYRMLAGKGSDWKGENENFDDDKYIPVLPAQGDFLYIQTRA